MASAAVQRVPAAPPPLQAATPLAGGAHAGSPPLLAGAGGQLGLVVSVLVAEGHLGGTEDGGGEPHTAGCQSVR